MKTKTLLHKTDRKYPDFKRLFFGQTLIILPDDNFVRKPQRKQFLSYGENDPNRSRIVSESWHIPVAEWEDRTLVEKFKSENY